MIFYVIDPHIFREDDVFGFPIFLYDLVAKKRIIICHAHSKINAENLSQWQIIYTKGGQFQIFHQDLTLFLESTKLNYEKIKEWNLYEIKARELEATRQKTYGDKRGQDFLFKIEFWRGIHSNDMQLIVRHFYYEVMCFPLNISSEVSFTVELVNVLYQKKLWSIKAAALSYFFAKELKIDDVEMQSSLILAVLFKDIGLTQIPIKSVYQNDTRDLDSTYQRHPIFSLFVLAKAPVEMSKMVKRLILEHHEIITGQGFPKGKKEHELHLLSSVIILTDQIMDRLIGIKKMDKNLKEIFATMAKGNNVKDLVTHYPDAIQKLIVKFANVEE